MTQLTPQLHKTYQIDTKFKSDTIQFKPTYKRILESETYQDTEKKELTILLEKNQMAF